MEPNPYVQAFIGPDPENPAGPVYKRGPAKKCSRSPIWEEKDNDFNWTVRANELDKDQTRIFIAVYEEKGLMSKKTFLGSMSFTLTEIWDSDHVTEGWFKLLDEKKGTLDNVAYIPKFKAGVQPAAGKTAVSKAEAPAKVVAPKVVAPAPVSRPAVVPPSKKSPAKKVAAPLVKVTAADFTFTKVLGRGSFGKVLLAEKKGDKDNVYAIKVLKKTAVVEDDDVAGTMTEKNVLTLSGGSPFLTRLHATFQTDSGLYFVMEFVNGGDLMFHIQNLNTFSVKQSQFYMGEILLGLWYMHSKGVIYRDLKLDNVMLNHEGHIKIADFGMCKERMFGKKQTTTFCGTPGYLAPEIVREEAYGASVDFWSLGVLCYEFLVGDSPFEADEDDELFDQILNAKVEFPAKLDSSAKDFVNALLNRDPLTRLGCGDKGESNIKRHPFFATFDWVKAAKLELVPPFKPDIKDPKKAECFDDEFTQEAAELTPADPGVIATIEQSEFNGFSFVNPKGIFGSPDAAGGDEEEAVNEHDLSKYSWYRPDLSRADVVTLLKGQVAGKFCVRESASQPGCYALSVSVSPKADKLWTGLITPTDDGRGGTRYRLFVKQKFDSIFELITYYHSSPCVTIDKGKREVVLVD